MAYVHVHLQNSSELPSFYVSFLSHLRSIIAIAKFCTKSSFRNQNTLAHCLQPLASSQPTIWGTASSSHSERNELLLSCCWVLCPCVSGLVWFSLNPFYLRVQGTSWIFMIMSFIKLGQVLAITSLAVPATKYLIYLMVLCVSISCPNVCNPFKHFIKYSAVSAALALSSESFLWLLQSASKHPLQMV